MKHCIFSILLLSCASVFGKTKADSTKAYIGRPYMCVSGFFGKMTAGIRSPFDHSTGIALTSGNPIMKNKATLDFSLEGNSFSKNISWYGYIASYNMADYINLKNSLSLEFNSSILFVIKNSNKYNFSLGPTLGVREIKIPNPKSLSFKNTHFRSGCIGVRANIYLRHRFLFSFAYSHFFVNTIDIVEFWNKNHINTKPMNTDMLQFRLGYYFQH